MFYERFEISDTIDTNVSESSTLSDAFESVGYNKNTSVDLSMNEIMALEALGDLYPVSSLYVAMEDGPFDDMGGGDDAGGGDMDAGGDDGGMPALPDEGQMMDDGGTGGDDAGFGDLGGDEDQNPFGDNGGGDGMGDDQNGDGEDKQQKGPQKLNRRKVIIDSTSIDTSIRGFIPQNFYKMIDVVENNINKIESLTSVTANQQKALANLVSVYTKMKMYLQDYFKTMPRRTYDDIFSEYVKTFYDMKQLRDSYLTIMNEKDVENYDSMVAKFNSDLRILTKDDVKMHDKEK
jgi:hypothetical protein